MISVDAYPFFAFLDLTVILGKRNRCFLVALCHLIVRRPNLENSNQEASLSAGKNSIIPTTISGGVDISEVSFATTNEFSVRVTKITSRTSAL